MALVLIVVGYGATRLLAPGPSAPAGEPIESVAVLPFENRTGDPEMAYLSSGIPEVLSNRLATITGLRVAPRGFAFRFGRALEDPREVAEKLEVRGVVSGWVDVVEGRLVVGVELVDAARMAHLWGDTYTRSRGDLIGLQSTVAHDIARELRPELDANEERRVGRSFTDDTLAYELYLKARQATYAGEGNRDNLRKALDLTRKCVDRDPAFAQAHALAAELQAMLGFWNFRPHEEVLPGARHAALAALEIEPRLAEPRAVLGWSKAVLEWKWREGIQDIREALDLEPDNVTALAFYSAVLPTMGRIDEAVRAAQRAYELDPFAPVAVQTLAWALFQRRRYEEAIEYMDKLVALDPDSQWASTFKVSALARSGRPEEALAVARLDAVPATPGADHSVGVSTVSLATIHAVAGDEEKARRLIGQLPPEHVPPGLWASLGEKDEAFAGLRRYVRERRSNYLMYLKTAPNWDPLRGDPRFDEILRQVGLSQ